MSDDYNKVVLQAFVFNKEEVVFFGGELAEAIKIPRADTGTLDGLALKNAMLTHALGKLALHTSLAARAAAVAAGEEGVAALNARLNNSRPVVSPIAAASTASFRATVYPTVAIGGDPISLAPGVSPLAVNRNVTPYQSAAAVAARVQRQQRQLKPALSCPLCNHIVISARGGTAKHERSCVFQAFVSLFNLKQRGSFGAARSHCAWMRLQNEGWVRGIRAALKRAETKKTLVVLLETGVVAVRENGVLTSSLALPRVVTASEIKEHVNQAEREAEDQAMDVDNGASTDGGVRERTASLASDRGSVTRQCM
jgi:hypothetical protein